MGLRLTGTTFRNTQHHKTKAGLPTPKVKLMAFSGRPGFSIEAETDMGTVSIELTANTFHELMAEGLKAEKNRTNILHHIKTHAWPGAEQIICPCEWCRT